MPSIARCFALWQQRVARAVRVWRHIDWAVGLRLVTITVFQAGQYRVGRPRASRPGGRPPGRPEAARLISGLDELLVASRFRPGSGVLDRIAQGMGTSRLGASLEGGNAPDV